MNLHIDYKDKRLLPCPFCNGQAIVRKWKVGEFQFQVVCSGCGSTSGVYKTQIDAVKKWNERVSVEDTG